MNQRSSKTVVVQTSFVVRHCSDHHAECRWWWMIDHSNHCFHSASLRMACNICWLFPLIFLIFKFFWFFVLVLFLFLVLVLCLVVVFVLFFVFGFWSWFCVWFWKRHVIFPWFGDVVHQQGPDCRIRFRSTGNAPHGEHLRHCHLRGRAGGARQSPAPVRHLPHAARDLRASLQPALVRHQERRRRRHGDDCRLLVQVQFSAPALERVQPEARPAHRHQPRLPRCARRVVPVHREEHEIGDLHEVPADPVAGITAILHDPRKMTPLTHVFPCFDDNPHVYFPCYDDIIVSILM